MRKIVLAALILAITASAADARRRHHHRFYVYKQAPVMLMAPDAGEMRSRRGRVDPVQLIPRDWQLLPPDPNWQGRRYMAPEGDAWLAFYATNAANDAQARFKAVAFGDGEQVTYLHGERDRLTVSGLKGDNIFYRKVTLACGGTIWRHVALEYPAAAKERSTASSSACRAASSRSPTMRAATTCSRRRSPRARQPQPKSRKPTNPAAPN